MTPGEGVPGGHAVKCRSQVLVGLPGLIIGLGVVTGGEIRFGSYSQTEGLQTWEIN